MSGINNEKLRSDAPVLLQMDNIEKVFPGVKALDKVSLTVKAGTVHALMGENGAGKSTLMKCLFGVYSKDSGNIFQSFFSKIGKTSDKISEEISSMDLAFISSAQLITFHPEYSATSFAASRHLERYSISAS